MGPRDGRARRPGDLFWREIDQLRAVVDHVVPRLAGRAPRHPLRIWSAPCATGEEPLTLAMMLDEARLVRSGADRDRRQRCQPRRRSRRRRNGRYGPARIPESAGGPAREVLHAARATTGRSCPTLAAAGDRYDIVNLDGRGRGGAARGRADHLLPQRVHLLLRPQHPPDVERVRAGDARRRGICVSGPRNRCCACDDAVRAPGDRRRVRLREGSARRESMAAPVPRHERV